MRRSLLGMVLASAGLAGVLWGCSSGERTDATQAREVESVPGTYLADFDRAWELVRDTHWDESHNGVDWEAVRTELRPRAEAATRRNQSRAIINEMVGRLKQSHFGVIPEEVERPGTAAASGSDDVANGENGSAMPPIEVSGGDGEGQAEVGLDVRVVDGRAVVTSVRAGGPADLAGVRPGWVLSKVRSVDVASVIAGMAEAVGEHEAGLYSWQSLTQILLGREGSIVPLTLLDGDDQETVITLTRVAPPGEFVKFGNLPPMSTHLQHRWLTAEETGDPDTRVGYIAFNIFMIPIAPQFERAMVEFQGADGVIVDLRGNLGGVGAMSGALSRFFVTEKTNLGTMSMRGANLEFNAEPVVVTSRGERLKPFTGPLAMLIDGTSASTSELFAGGLRVVGRARTFGDRTAGMALPAAMDRLPSGDVLLHAIADYVNSDGSRLEGDGVPADVEVPVRREDLLAGVDAPLREAARWIVNEAAAAQPAQAESN